MTIGNIAALLQTNIKRSLSGTTEMLGPKGLHSRLQDEKEKQEKLVMEQKARRIIRGLFDAFVDEPRLLPRPIQERLDGTDRHRVVCDFVSGLTDRSALDLYNRLFETYEFGFGGGTTP